MDTVRFQRLKALLRKQKDEIPLSDAEKSELVALKAVAEKSCSVVTKLQRVATAKSGKGAASPPTDAEIAKHTPYGQPQALGVIRAGSAKSSGAVVASQVASALPSDDEMHKATPTNESAILGYIRAASAIRQRANT
jgi:hypothetical protein